MFDVLFKVFQFAPTALLSHSLLLSNEDNKKEKVKLKHDNDKAKSDEDSCPFEGKWINQLNSVMEITCSNGTIRGKYNSAVGKATQEYTLRGRYSAIGQKGYVVGWSVAWKNKYMDAQSVTSWTGIYYKGKEQIKTQWVLTSYKDLENYWRANYTNQDVFHRKTE